jgi:3-methyladenine DNA glycosylase AlkD
MTQSAVALLLSQIEAELRPMADAAQAVAMRAYMLNQFAFLGIRATARRQALRGLPRLNTWAASDLLSLAEVLWDLP